VLRDSPVTGLPVLVALPGTICSPEIFGELQARLSGRIVIDGVSWMGGDGPWDIPSVANAVAEHIRLSLDPPVMVAGHSTGGAIAIWLAAEHPELVSGLMLLNTGPHMRGHGDVDAIIEALTRDWEATTTMILARSFASSVPDSFRSTLEDFAAVASPQAASAVLYSQRDLDLTDRLGSVLCPVVVVHGVLDRVRTVSGASELEAAIANATLSLVEAGHSPMFEAPDVVAELVLELLNKVAGTDSAMRQVDEDG